MFWCPTRPPHPYQNVRSLSIARMMCVSFRTPTMLATHISPPSSFPDFLYLEFVFGFFNFLARFIGVAWRGRVGGWGRRVGVVRGRGCVGCGPCGGGRSPPPPPRNMFGFKSHSSDLKPHMGRVVWGGAPHGNVRF